MGVSDQFTSSVYVANVESSEIRPIQMAPAEIIITLLLPTKADIGSTLFPTLFPAHSSPSDSQGPDSVPPIYPSLPSTLCTHLRLILSLLGLPSITSLRPLTLALSSDSSCGVAHTHDGTITLSSTYIASQIAKFASENGDGAGAEGVLGKARREIEGVLCHELVHVVQEDGQGSAPGWWIEGVADWARGKAGMGAEHWRPEGHGTSYTDSYETTALFLAHLTDRVHPPLVALINSRLRESAWDDGWFEEYTGKTVLTLWGEYKAFYALALESGTKTSEGEARPTHAVKM